MRWVKIQQLYILINMFKSGANFIKNLKKCWNVLQQKLCLFILKNDNENNEKKDDDGKRRKEVKTFDKG